MRRRSLFDSSEVRWAPREVRTRKKVHLTPMKLNGPNSSGSRPNSEFIFFWWVMVLLDLTHLSDAGNRMTF